MEPVPTHKAERVSWVGTRSRDSALGTCLAASLASFRWKRAGAAVGPRGTSPCPASECPLLPRAGTQGVQGPNYLGVSLGS